MASTASDSNHQNLVQYSSAEVAGYYASLNYLTGAERLLFGKFLHTGMAILDLGVGGGRTTPYLSSIAKNYVGGDYSSAMVDACRKKFPDLEFELAAAEDLSQFAPSRFDAVVMAFNAIDYVFPKEARWRATREIHRVLKPNGIFIFSSHNPRSVIIRPSWNSEYVRSVATSIVSRDSIFFRPVFAGLTVLRMMGAWIQAAAKSLARIFNRLPTRTFWQSRGYLMDSAHGGLMTFFAIPRQIQNELEKHGFHLLEALGDDYPRPSHLYMTDWYYYVFSKTKVNLEK